MLHMRNCDTKATSPIFWEKEQNSVKEIGSSNLGRPLKAIKGLRMFLIGAIV